MSRSLLMVLILSILVLSACQGRSLPNTGVSKEAADIPLTPYWTPTATNISPTGSNRLIVTPTPAPSPTPTPITHTIVEGDTMLAIAFKYGIKLEELLAANPEVDPRLLSVGVQIIIPFGESSPAVFATATPLPIGVEPAQCYPDVQRGMWCFVLITNDRSRPLENITGRISLVDPGGEILAEDEAILPLNIIPVDQSLPLMVYFDDEIEGSFTAFVELVSALPVPRNDERYLNAWIEIEEVEISLEGEQASVYGEVGLPSRSQSAGIVWLAAVAYDEEEKVVAVRKIELNSSIEPGTARPFEIDLYSLGPEIDRVDVLVEARP